MKEPNIVMLLMSAIVALSGCIVWLALYIKGLHNGHVDMVEKTVESQEKLKSSIDGLAHNIANNTKVTDDLHRLFLTNLSTHKTI